MSTLFFKNQFSCFVNPFALQITFQSLNQRQIVSYMRQLCQSTNYKKIKSLICQNKKLLFWEKKQRPAYDEDGNKLYTLVLTQNQIEVFKMVCMSYLTIFMGKKDQTCFQKSLEKENPQILKQLTKNFAKFWKKVAYQDIYAIQKAKLNRISKIHQMMYFVHGKPETPKKRRKISFKAQTAQQLIDDLMWR